MPQVTKEAGLDQLELALRQQELELAQQDFLYSAKDLAELEPGPDHLESALLEAQVALARSAADEAREDLEGAMIRAPFRGVVSRINIETDDAITDESRVMALVDPNRLEVHGLVDASEIQFIRLGAAAQVAIGSLPRADLTGVVINVSSSPRTERGVITFPIVVRIDLPEGVSAPLELSGVSMTVTAIP